jgi:hypothetical protein
MAPNRDDQFAKLENDQFISRGEPARAESTIGADKRFSRTDLVWGAKAMTGLDRFPTCPENDC